MTQPYLLSKRPKNQRIGCSCFGDSLRVRQRVHRGAILVDAVAVRRPKPFESHGRCLALIDENSAVLDIGCGNGRLAALLRGKGCYVVGIDIDPETAKAAQENCDEFVCANIEEYSFETCQRSFDVVLCADVLEHLLYPEQFLKKVKNVLKPQACLIVSVPNVANWRVRISLLRGEFAPEHSGILDRTHLHFYTLSTVTQMIEAAGFKICALELAYFGDRAKRGHRLGKAIRWLGNHAKELLAYQFIMKAHVQSECGSGDIGDGERRS